VPPRPRPTPDELREAILVELDAVLDQPGTEAYERATRAADAAVNTLSWWLALHRRQMR
jgi:hypothetical protein